MSMLRAAHLAFLILAGLMAASACHGGGKSGSGDGAASSLGIDGRSGEVAPLAADAALPGPRSDAAPEAAPADGPLLDRQAACQMICGHLVEPCAVYSPPQWPQCEASCRAATPQQIACAERAWQGPLDTSCMDTLACLRGG
jgi:hypothetical protein